MLLRHVVRFWTSVLSVLYIDHKCVLYVFVKQFFRVGNKYAEYEKQRRGFVFAAYIDIGIDIVMHSFLSCGFPSLHVSASPT